MIKKFLSLCVLLSMLILVALPCNAVSNKNVEFVSANESNYLRIRNSDEEVFIGEFIAQGQTHTLTSRECNDVCTIYEYVNGQLKYMSMIDYASSCYKHARIDDDSAVISTNGIPWKTVYVEVNCINMQGENDNLRVVDRYIGHMHHRDSNGTLRSISCNVREWYAYQYTMDIVGTWGSSSEFVADLAASVLIDTGTALGFLRGLLAAGIIWIMGDMINTATSTVFYCNKVEQEIYGVSTTHPNTTNTGTLPKGIIAVGLTANNMFNGEIKVSGYTTRDWGSSDLGSRMFYRVYGMELIPTHWTM